VFFFFFCICICLWPLNIFGSHFLCLIYGLKERPKGSLEEVVQNAIKTWDMEIEHKTRVQDIKTINPDTLWMVHQTKTQFGFLLNYSYIWFKLVNIITRCKKREGNRLLLDHERYPIPRRWREKLENLSLIEKSAWTGQFAMSIDAALDIRIVRVFPGFT
jgi:hypothetical protein